ncbi:MAG: peptide deformylase [Candidatus Omnitrophica bacterium]|nr:peptide deformylase [Candidatus Omnitrophota bacterium]
MSGIRLKVRIYGDPCLREKTRPVDKITPALRLMLKTMVNTMYEEDGVGLAASQVGINESFFVADMGDGPGVYINPQIYKQSGEETMEEGCLSLPGLTIKVARPKNIQVSYRDVNFENITRDLEGLHARIFLHESDHLIGRLLLDYVDEKDRPALEKKIQPNPSG